MGSMDKGVKMERNGQPNESRNSHIALRHILALATGAAALGTVVIGAFAIARLHVGKAYVKRLHIGRLEVDELIIKDNLAERDVRSRSN